MSLTNYPGQMAGVKRQSPAPISVLTHIHTHKCRHRGTLDYWFTKIACCVIIIKHPCKHIPGYLINID